MYRIRKFGPLNYLIFPSHILQFLNTDSDFANVLGNTVLLNFFFSLLALQPPLGVVFYSPLVGFSLLAYEVS